MPFRPLETTQSIKPETTSQFRPIPQEEVPIVVAPESQGFLGRLSTKFKERGQNFTKSLEGQARGEQGTASTVLQLFGQGGGFIGDVIGETLLSGAKAILPNFLEKGTSDAIKNVMGTPTGQQALQALNSGMDAYNSFKEKNPEFARNLEAVLNIGDAALSVTGLGVAKTALKESAKELAEKSAVTTGKVLGNKGQGAAESILASTLKLNPSDVMKIEAPNVAGMSPEKWLLERGIQGDQKQIRAQLKTRGADAKKKVDEGLNAIKDTYDIRNFQKATPAGKILDILEQNFTGVPGNDDILGVIQHLKGKQKLNLTDMNAIKRLVDRELELFSKSGDVKSGATARGLENLRSQLQEFIEINAKGRGFEDVAQLNKEVQVSRAISDAIRRKTASSDRNRLVSLTDFIGGGVGGLIGGFPGLLLTIGFKKGVLENPKFRTAFAKRLYELGDDKLRQIDNAMIAKNETTLKKLLLPIATALKEQDFSGELTPEEEDLLLDI